jgi:hypothetical protein
MQNCQDDDRVYDNLQQCELVCAELDLGESAPVVEAPAELDTVQCRYFWASRAGEPSFCQSAGPLGQPSDGSSQCGERCENYCNMLQGECPTQFEALENCQRQCAAVPNEPPYRVPGNGEGLPNANTLQCRMYHLNVAMTVREITSEHDGHCRHAVGIDLCAAPE